MEQTLHEPASALWVHELPSGNNLTALFTRQVSTCKSVGWTLDTPTHKPEWIVPWSPIKWRKMLPWFTEKNNTTLMQNPKLTAKRLTWSHDKSYNRWSGELNDDLTHTRAIVGLLPPNMCGQILFCILSLSSWDLRGTVQKMFLECGFKFLSSLCCTKAFFI